MKHARSTKGTKPLTNAVKTRNSADVYGASIADHARDLAHALAEAEETTLGPTDAALCAVALRAYAERPALLSRLAVAAGAVALGALGIVLAVWQAGA